MNAGPLHILDEIRKVVRGADKQDRRPHRWDGKAIERI
jgi:hypothetical protein